MARQLVAGALGAAGVVYFMPTVHADVLEKGDIPKRIAKAPSILPSTGQHELDTFAWGSNKLVGFACAFLRLANCSIGTIRSPPTTQ